MKNIFFYGFLLICCSVFAENPIITNVDFNALVQQWNKAHDTKNTSLFAIVFDDTVLFYGKQESKADCISKKIALFKKFPDFKQETGIVSQEKQADGTVKCSFTKTVHYNGKNENYPSYLIFKLSGSDWKIIVESDLITDKNLAKKKTNAVKVPENAEKGDFNGDGKFEYMWLETPQLSENEMDCIGSCNSYIRFSDATIPTISIQDCIDGIPVNKGDLNGNGTDEIGLLPVWFTSCWHSYYVWTLKNGKWIYAVKPFPTHCNQWENDVIPIEIDKKRKGNVIIRYSLLTDDDIIVKTASVKIN
ncbi:hypothetical protein [Flavobacterium cerinum]|uniref:Nuclear transport factor 2 family protein n=1 Tax=Flavobacterium cerinum TaxID=2502784 RepID=A0ABY5IQR5_9FLAO|nr:hypothetical protein [Flavobacterium cerinum]UUC45099.1 hypothetical protein NOX80_15920 [Flavobacterium cerinum]